MAIESGRASSPPKWAIWGSGEWLGRRGGGCRIAASRCLRRASSWASAFCFLLILAPEAVRLLRVSLELLRRRKLKLERRGALGASPLGAAAALGSALSSGEPSRAEDGWSGLLGVVMTGSIYEQDGQKFKGRGSAGD